MSSRHEQTKPVLVPIPRSEHRLDRTVGPGNGEFIGPVVVAQDIAIGPRMPQDVASLRCREETPRSFQIRLLGDVSHAPFGRMIAKMRVELADREQLIPRPLELGRYERLPEATRGRDRQGLDRCSRGYWRRSTVFHKLADDEL